VTPKEYLQQYRNAEDSINAKLDQIHKLRELATKTTQTLTADNVQSSGSEDKISVIVSKIVDMENEVDAEIDELHDIKNQVEGVISAVPNAKQRAVLTRRYINGYTWERIAVDLDISYQWVCELHGRALQKIMNS
jgi:DNA-directed RNA polymerase specialized sigma subunit